MRNEDESTGTAHLQRWKYRWPPAHADERTASGRQSPAWRPCSPQTPHWPTHLHSCVAMHGSSLPASQALSHLHGRTTWPEPADALAPLVVRARNPERRDSSNEYDHLNPANIRSNGCAAWLHPSAGRLLHPLTADVAVGALTSKMKPQRPTIDVRSLVCMYCNCSAPRCSCASATTKNMLWKAPT